MNQTRTRIYRELARVLGIIGEAPNLVAPRPWLDALQEQEGAEDDTFSLVDGFGDVCYSDGTEH